MPRPPRDQPGFVLLLTLVLLALAAVALAGIGRRSAQQAVRALEAEAALQRRWAVRSATDALLPQAEALLTAEKRLQRTTGGDPAVARRTLKVGPYTATLLFADEQAKLNLNALLTSHPIAQVRSRLQQIARDEQFHGIELHPVGAVERRLNQLPEQWPAFTSFEQVLPGVAPGELVAFDAAHAGPAQRLTLWGNGRLNVHRADAAVLTAALSPHMSATQVRRLVTLRQAEPTPSLETLLNQLELDEEARATLEPRLTEASLCHSLWIVLEDDQRAHHILVVRTQTVEENADRAAPVAADLHRLIW